MKPSCEMHVISNTHWDREWSANFQETRMRLVEFLDALLEILDTEPGYRSFLLDSQVVPIEDYLEVRPECRDRIVKHVTGGRLLIGPWYTCPEEFCVNGESLVRNLWYGHRVARALGQVMKVGYSPFSYGQTSQMPQIYAGFGIDTILFYHGVTHGEAPNEFIFEGPDGTRAFASQISGGARYNFYHKVYRKVVFPYEKDDRLYTWDQGGLPFHFCTEDTCEEQHTLLEPVPHFDKERLAHCVRELRDEERRVATTRYLAFMMGHDSSVPDAVELRLIEEAQDATGQDALLHSSLPEWVAKVKAAAKDLPILKGERRTPKVRTGRVHLYSDVLSSRARMKRFNARTEIALQRWAEPFSTMAWCLGREYPSSLLDLAWTTLLKCHAHDSIAGSGVDDIELDQHARMRQTAQIARGITERSLALIQRHINNAEGDPDDVLITAFNASAFPRTEVLTAVLDVPPCAASREFDLIAADGKTRVPVQVVTRRPHYATMNHAGDAAHMMSCEQVKFHFEARGLPALGYSTFRFNPKGRFTRGSLICGSNALENEHLHVQIHDNGTLSIRHKASGMEFDGLHYFEDSGEAGQAWMHVEPGSDKVINSRGFPVSVSLEEDGPLLARYRIEHFLKIPSALGNAGSNAWERLDGFDNSARRSAETTDLNIISVVTLRKGARSVEVQTRFHNAAENHRLRVVFPTRLSRAKNCWAESAFDVVERPIVPGPGHPWHGIGKRTFPMQRFIDVSDGKAGLAILNDGLREYEVTQDPERAIAVTLLRAFEVSICTSAAGWDVRPGMKLSQSPGEHEYRYVIYPHVGRWDEAEVLAESELLAAPVRLAQAGRHGGTLPKNMSFFQLTPSNLVLSAMHRSSSDDSLLIRLFNPTEKIVTGTLTFFKPVRAAELVTLEEAPVRKLKPEGKKLALRVGSRKIITLKIAL
ncbi:MAG TPA: glycoside hydrolase family 38 C-terminal domain-containing protein [Candidatus Hydrogenedentes bacterium]|nr:glycoside hydrolase family 38 C-terminal domain-containing protein [Candidatus Hydrogenedentota bacterium]